MNAKYRIWVVVVLMIGFYHGCGMSSQALAADRLRVVVLPFQIHSETEMTYLQKGISEILISRLAGIKAVEIVDPTKEMEASLEDLRNAAEKQQVDYVVRGSISIIGKHGSIDATVISFSGTENTWPFYRKIDNLDAVIPATEDMAKEIEQTVFNGSNQEESVADSIKNSSLMNPRKRTAFRSDALPEQIIGIGIGDIDRNGKIEIVAASGHDIHIYHVTENGFFHAADIVGKSYHSYLAVDVADINGNGTAEIYISCEHAGSGSLESFVLEWNGGQFVPIQQDQNWYFRVIRTQKGDQLFGQKKGMSTAYIPGIYKLLWMDSALIPATQKEAFPDDIMVFGVSKGFAGQDAGLTAAFDSSDRLSIINENGGIVWKSDVPYGGSERFIKTVEDYRKSDGDRFYLPQRIIALDVEKKSVVIVPSNDSFSGRFFQKFRNYTNARFLSFTWDGMGLVLSRKSQDLSGYVSDFCIADLNNDGLEELVYALVADRETAFRSAKSYIASEDLSGLIIRHP